ncbi:unnamed protein product [Heterobilharzia americana]|nr:unnamed protein product [Heterobilharzia americana]CAH8501645.1 unnamed protein product [Heterobilharzia americana]
MTDYLQEVTKTPEKKRKLSKLFLNKIEKITKSDDKYLDSQVNTYQSNKLMYSEFFQFFEQWYHKNERKYIQYLSIYNREFITKVEFKLALKDLNIPLNNVQLHMIYKWLDPENTGLVEYIRLYEVFCRVLVKYYTEDIEDEIYEMNLEDTEKWIMMTFKQSTYNRLDMPTSFKQLIHLDYTGSMLIQLIYLKIPQLPSYKLVLFTDPVYYNKTIIHFNQKLYDFDFIGGSKITPTEGTIYYDYSMGYIDAPLLLNREIDESSNLLSTLNNQQSKQNSQQENNDQQSVDSLYT